MQRYTHSLLLRLYLSCRQSSSAPLRLHQLTQDPASGYPRRSKQTYTQPSFLCPCITRCRSPLPPLRPCLLLLSPLRFHLILRRQTTFISNLTSLSLTSLLLLSSLSWWCCSSLLSWDCSGGVPTILGEVSRKTMALERIFRRWRKER